MSDLQETDQLPPGIRKSKRGVTSKGVKRKLRRDSTAARIQRIQDAKRPLHEPLTPLPEKAMVFWNAIMTSRMWEEWTEAELILAGRLARLQAELTELQEEADSVPMMVKGKTAPIHLLIHKLLQREITFARGLKIAGTVKGPGPCEDQLKKDRHVENTERARIVAREAAIAAGEDDEDSLLAG